MKKTSTQNISDLLRNSSLTKIVQKANEVNDLNQKMQKLFAEHYRGLYRIVNLVNNQLVIEVPNATIRQGLQLHALQMLALVQQNYPHINECLFKINPDFKRF